MDDFTKSVVGVLTAVVGVSIVAVIVSKNAQTSNVLQAFFTGFAGLVQAAVSPITSGGSVSSGVNSLGGLSDLTTGFGSIIPQGL